MLEQESGPDLLQRVLSSYEIGRKLKQLRLRKKIALTELGKHTGLSASMISQLENGKLTPTLPTLARIALVFDIGLDHFFGSQRKEGMIEVVKAAERMKFPNSPDADLPNYFFEVLAFQTTNKPIDCYLAEFPARRGEETVPHLHAGHEFLYILEGQVELDYQAEAHLLERGDSVYFDSSELHSYRGVSKKPAKALVISAPALR